MKNFLGIFVITIISMMALISCEPVENRLEMKGGVTEADVKAKVIVELVVREGKKSNYIHFNSESLVNCVTSFTHGLGTFVGKEGTVQGFVVAGNFDIIVNVLNADGTSLPPISFPVTVEECFDVDPEWAIFCGSGEKVWTWDENGDDNSRVWGNGAYKVSPVPDWWGRTVDEMDEEVPGNGKGATMTFSASGATLTKLKTDGVTEKGTFSFDMSKKIEDVEGNNWSIGHLSTKEITVLNGKQQNVGENPPLYEYEILKLTEDEMVLGWPTGSDPDVGPWSEAWYWFFKPVK